MSGVPEKEEFEEEWIPEQNRTGGKKNGQSKDTGRRR